jgi:hypothetical protein
MPSQNSTSDSQLLSRLSRLGEVAALQDEALRQQAVYMQQTAEQRLYQTFVNTEDEVTFSPAIKKTPPKYLTKSELEQFAESILMKSDSVTKNKSYFVTVNMKREDRKKIRNRIYVDFLIKYKNEIDYSQGEKLMFDFIKNTLIHNKKSSARHLFKKSYLDHRNDNNLRFFNGTKIAALRKLRQSYKDSKHNSLYKKLKTQDRLHNSIYNKNIKDRKNPARNRSLLDRYLNGENITLSAVDKAISSNRIFIRQNILTMSANEKNFVSGVIAKQQVIRRGKTKKYNFDLLQVPIIKRDKYQSFMKVYDKNINHKPIATKKHFGVEIECVFPTMKAFELFKSLTEKLKQVTYTTDGSLRKERDDNVLQEIKVLTDESFSNLKEVCKHLKSVGAFVNKSCGLHVHLDYRSQHSQIVERTMLSRFDQNLLGLVAMLVPEKRRSNSFCKKQISRSERYSYINLQSLDRHSTVEVRLHSGTINFEKIVNWINLWSYLFYSKRLNKFDNTNLASFLDSLPDKNLGDYYKERAKLFNKQDVLDAHGITFKGLKVVVTPSHITEIEFNERDELCASF